jgi:thymidylate kinase
MRTIFTLEGPDGCGKTNHTNMLKDKFEKDGISTLVFHHNKPTDSNAYLDFFEQRKNIFAEFIQSDNQVLIMDRNIYSSIVFSATYNSVFKANRKFLFNSDSYIRLNEVKEEIEFISKMKEIIKEEIYFNTLIVNCSSDVLDERMKKRGEEVIERDYLVRNIYNNTNFSLSKLREIYNMNTVEFEYMYVNYVSQTKEEFSIQIYNFLRSQILRTEEYLKYKDTLK